MGEDVVVTRWQERKAVGDAHEQRVASALTAQGWTVERCGQGTYPPAIQQALACTTSALRWFPDLITARAGEVVTIDAKDCMPSNSSGRYAVADEAVHAGIRMASLDGHQHGIHHSLELGAGGCIGLVESGGAARYGAKAVSAASR